MTVKGGLRVEKIGTCLLCGATGLPFYSNMRDQITDVPSEWAFLRCPKCGLVWLNPRPIPGHIGKVYRNYCTHVLEDQRPTLAWVRNKIKPALFTAGFGYDGPLGERNARYINGALKLIPLLRDRIGRSVMWVDWSKGGRLLDVGCGNGKFLALMRDLGWEVLGIEPDPQAARIALERFGVPVIVGTLEETGLPEESFDALTMHHVIEHVHNPIGLLKECRRVLKTDGKLVVVTPNVESLGHGVFQDSWRGLEPPRHLYLYSMRTLRDVTVRAGLRIIVVRTIAQAASKMWAESRLIQSKAKVPHLNVPWHIKLESAAFRVVEEVMRPIWKNAGEELLLIATKRDR